MNRRKRDHDPNDLTEWIGQPYTPHDPHYVLLHPSRSGSPLKGYAFYGCLLLGGFALTCAALFAVGLFRTSPPAFWALLVLLAAAAVGTLAGLASAQRRRQARAAHHHHHKGH